MITYQQREISISFGKKFYAFITPISLGIQYFGSEHPWVMTDRDFRWEFRWIPNDIEFWQHALWVCRNPELLARFLHEDYVIYEGKIRNRIPF